MNFDEWYKNYLITAESWNRNLAKKAWDAAIDEATKVAMNLDGLTCDDDYGVACSDAYQVAADKIKELK